MGQGDEVVVDFSCSDEQGGSGLASCVGTTADGETLDTSRLGDVSVTVTARDNAGNQRVVTHTVTVVDDTSPKVTIATPQDGAVYARGASVTADYSCADEENGSGLQSCVGDVPDGGDVDTSTLGEHTFTVQATDRAGNTGSKSVNYTVVDRTAPVISVATPSAGAVYGLGESVAADYSCADEPGGSGLASCAGTVADGAAVDTSSVGQKTLQGRGGRQRRQQVLEERHLHGGGPGASRDQPGGAGRRRGLLARPEGRSRRTRARTRRAARAWRAATGRWPNGAPIDTSSFGEHTFEVRAADRAGNTASKVVTYTVRYDFDGFRWPVKNAPTMNKWKAAVPVPIRFSLNGFRGARPEADGYPRSTRCGGGDVQTARARASKKEPAFRYNRRKDEYVLLWKTEQKWNGSCREFVLRLDDGSVHTARFQFTKKPNR